MSKTYDLHYEFDVSPYNSDATYPVKYSFSVDESEIQEVVKEYVESEDYKCLERTDVPESVDEWMADDGFVDFLLDWCREPAYVACTDDPETWDCVADAEFCRRNFYVY